MRMAKFNYKHLPEKLQATSKQFHDIAHDINDNLETSDTEEKEIGLRYLLLAKDAIVRAAGDFK